MLLDDLHLQLSHSSPFPTVVKQYSAMYLRVRMVVRFVGIVHVLMCVYLLSKMHAVFFLRKNKFVFLSYEHKITQPSLDTLDINFQSPATSRNKTVEYKCLGSGYVYVIVN